MTEEAKTEKTLPSLTERNEMLRQQGYRLTPQRYLVLQILEKVSEHVSLEELFGLVKEQYPHVNLSTIYRTLDLLQELSLVRETAFPGESAKYEMFSGETHHHIVCQNCRRVLHVEDPLQEQLLEEILQRYQFHEVTMDIMSRGYCDECWQKRQQQPLPPLPL